MTDTNRNNNTDQDMNSQQQAVDKAPGEDRGTAEQVTKEDLKGKKVDADLDRGSDKPLQRS